MTTPRQRQIERVLKMLEDAHVPSDGGRMWLDNLLELKGGMGLLRACLLSREPDSGTLDQRWIVASTTLTGVTSTDGVLDADDATFHTVSGAVVGVAVVHDGAILVYVPFPSPATGTASDMTVSWHVNGIVRLAP